MFTMETLSAVVVRLMYFTYTPCARWSFAYVRSFAADDEDEREFLHLFIVGDCRWRKEKVAQKWKMNGELHDRGVVMSGKSRLGVHKFFVNLSLFSPSPFPLSPEWLREKTSRRKKKTRQRKIITRIWQN